MLTSDDYGMKNLENVLEEILNEVGNNKNN